MQQYINSLYMLECHSLQQKYRYYHCFNSIKPSVAFHIETSHLPGIANQMIGFYMKRNTWLKWINPLPIILTFFIVLNVLHLYVSHLSAFCDCHCLLRVFLVSFWPLWLPLPSPIIKIANTPPFILTRFFLSFLEQF